MSEVVLYETDGPVAKLVINRPDKLNALNAGTVAALDKFFKMAVADDSIKVILLAGAGRSFSAGFDMQDEIDAHLETPLQYQPLLRRDADFTMRIWACPKPTIAMVHGYCLGGACELAMACDMIVATDDARFGEPEIQYGGGPVTLLMPFVLGQKKTNELLLTGDKIDATEALRLGLVNQVVSVDELDAAARALALRVAPTPLPVLRLTKQAINRAYEAMGLRAAVDANVDISAMLNAANAPEQLEFNEIAKIGGLKAALAWRDGRYGNA